jgi:hypothetical protein
VAAVLSQAASAGLVLEGLAAVNDVADALGRKEDSKDSFYREQRHSGEYPRPCPRCGGPHDGEISVIEVVLPGRETAAAARG